MLRADELKSPAPFLALEQPQDEPAQDAIYVQTRPQPPSPVFGLPPEISRHIFRILFDMHLQAITAWRRQHEWDISLEELPQPWTLSKIRHPWITTLQACRLWRWAAADYGGLWTDITSRWPSRTRIALPSVEHISVIDEVLCMGHCLARFSHPRPSNAHYRFIMFDEDSPPIVNHIRHLAVLDLASRVSSLIGGSLAYLAFADNAPEDGPRKLELDANIGPISDASSSPPAMTLVFDCLGGDAAHLSCFQAVLDGLGGQLAHVEKMRLLDMDPYMAIDWARPLGRMRRLRDLTISADRSDPIVELLSAVAAEHRGGRTVSTAREVCLPALEHLTLSLLGRDEELFKLVARALERRVNVGFRLPVLTMHMVDDPLQPHDEMLLSRVVSSLVSENETYG